MLKPNYARLITILISLFIVGCSGGGVSSPVAPDDAQLPELQAAVSPEIEGKAAETQHGLWGMWTICYDPATNDLIIEPERNIQVHFNITAMVQPPACDDCLEISVNSFDPVTRIMDVDVTLINRYAITGYDVRGILHTNDAGHLLTNPDAWTGLWDIIGGQDINPFKAFYEGATHGEFGPDDERMENYLVYIPKPPQYQYITFAVDGSWPGNCKEPYDISDFSHEPIYDTVGSTAEAQVSVFDWQDDVDEVLLSAPDITGEDFTEFSHYSGDIWKLQLTNNSGAAAGDYEALITASSAAGADVDLYDFVTITITEADSPVVTGIDPDEGEIGSSLVDVTVTGVNFAGPGAQVKLKKELAPDIVALSVVVVDVNTITCDIDIPLEAPLGIYDVEVTNGDSKAGVGEELFEVLPLSPVVTAIYPDEGETGADLDGVTITGENFNGPGAQVKLKMDSEPDIVATNVVVADSNTITCDISIPLTAEDGAYDVEVTNGDLTVGVGEGLFIVYGVNPVVTGIDPHEGIVGSDLTDVTVDGANFKGPGAQVKLKMASEPDIAATNVAVVDSNTISCDISIPPDAQTGLYDVEVANGDATVGAGEDLFEVLPDIPYVTGIIPNELYQGQDLDDATVSGFNFKGPVAQVKLRMASEPDIVATDVVVVDANAITCDISIPLDAAPGKWDVEVTNGDGMSGTGEGMIKIYDSTPVVAKIEPGKAEQTEQLIGAEVSGSNFIGPGATSVTLKKTGGGAPDIVATNVVVKGPNAITCDISIPVDAEPGMYDVEVTNGYGNTGTGSELFNVTEIPAPVVSNIDPDKGLVGTSLYDVEIDGDYFFGPAQVKLKKSGAPDITATNVVVVGPKEITCDISIPLLAETGLYDVEVTTGGGKVGSGVGLFIVYAPVPTVSEIQPHAGKQGEYISEAKVTGTNFVGPGPTSVTLKMTGAPDIVASNVVVHGSETIICDIGIPINADAGLYDVEVINGYGQVGTGSELFRVDAIPGPIVTTINPDESPSDVDLYDVDIVGDNFEGPGAQVKLKMASAPDIVATNVVVNDKTKIRCDISIPLSAPVGLYDVEVTNGNGKIGTGIELFDILGPAPTVDGIDPNTGEAGQDLEGVLVAGTNFVGPGATEVRLIGTGTPDIIATNVVVESSTHIVCDIGIPWNQGMGLYNVRVTNGYGLQGTGMCLFTVSCPTPVVTGIAPDHGYPGLDYSDVEVTGSDFWGGGPGAGVVIERDGGSDIVATNVTVEDGQTIHCDFSIPSDKLLGNYDVRVINGCGTEGVGSGLFEIRERGWVNTGFSILDDSGTAVTTDEPNSIYVTGYRMDAAGLLRRYGSSMSVLMSKLWDGTGSVTPYDIVLDPLNNIYIVGAYEGTIDFDPDPVDEENRTAAAYTDAFLVSFDWSGDFRFVRTWGGAGYDEAKGVAAGVGDYIIYVTGYFYGTVDFATTGTPDEHTSEGGNDVFLAKYGTSGAYEWARTWGGDEDDGGVAVAYNDGGEIYVVGSYADVVDFNPYGGTDNWTSKGLDDIFLTKYSGAADYLWTRGVGGAGNDYPHDVLTDGTYIYVTGEFRETVKFYPPLSDPDTMKTSAGESDIFLLKYDSGSLFQWVRAVGGPGEDAGLGIARDSSTGNLFISGCFRNTVDFNPGSSIDSHNSNGSADAFISRYKSDGDYGWTRDWGGAGFEVAHGVAISAPGAIYITGCFSDTVDFDPGSGVHEVDVIGAIDFYLLKLLPSGWWFD